MDISKLPFQSKILTHSRSAEEYSIYLAALEWDLIEPIVIEEKGDIHSESKWRNNVEPYHHQVTNLITFCRRLPVTLLADDVGLGKTISAGLIASELISRNRIQKILIVCPKILREQWKEELETKFNIPCLIVTGRELIGTKPAGEIGAIITTYNTARLYLERIKQGSFDMLILDEAHKLRNLYGVDPTPKVAQKLRKALSDRLFKYVLMLTATPIQNRLWDLYSLVDLLTVARGHENPFGSQGNFARRFIADNKAQARQLKPEMREEFRSIVYGYMSRVRRGDANLHFPERKVQLHKVAPSEKELELFNVIAKPIQNLNYLAQIIILQALVSSPEALVKLLEGMAKKETAPRFLFEKVKDIAKDIKITTKLNGLFELIKNLRLERPEAWRVVVFTRWRETQIIIQNFLGEQGISCGLINGDSNTRNQEVIAKFKKDIPDINVIISTEAGSEGVNLQAANVLVNYDLPWNPMIVEQRIGRIQRLSSNFDNVSVFNIVLKGTFEEYIVGRLMEKLQLASSAIGDIEALLEASGINETEDDNESSFEEKIRQLVIASLTGKDVEQATKKAEKSIEDAKVELESEKQNINTLLGGGGNSFSNSPRCPRLPSSIKSMDVSSFVLSAFKQLGAKITSQSNGLYIVDLASRKEIIKFDDKSASDEGVVLYAPGTAALERLISKLTTTGLHQVDDNDERPVSDAEKISESWVKKFGGIYKSSEIQDVLCCFKGRVLVRVRATVAHDSYERLVDIKCGPDEHFVSTGLDVKSIENRIENPSLIGISIEKIFDKASKDDAISDFCRFYIERREEEILSAGSDVLKKKKLEDEFTPRLDMSLVAMEGAVYRQLKTKVSYQVDSNDYSSIVNLTPSNGEIIEPKMGRCIKTGSTFPEECLTECEISKEKVLKHLLLCSEVSGRLALPEYTTICELTKMRVLTDEVERSDVTGKAVAKHLLKTSAMTNRKAESQYFSMCDFSKTEILNAETEISQVSGRKYRLDEQLKSVISGKTGHKSEFIFCAETNQPLVLSESEKCDVTGKIVIPGLLQRCDISGKKVLPSELYRSSFSDKKALKEFFVESNISDAPLLREEAVKSIAGKFCSPDEARYCQWSGRLTHPDDLRDCDLTGLVIRSEYLTLQPPMRLEVLSNILNGVRSKSDRNDLWAAISNYVMKLMKSGAVKVENAELSPDGKKLAVVLEIKTWIGLKVRYSGMIYSIEDKNIIGHIISGKRSNEGWIKS